MISPLGLYYSFDGTVVHSDDGPEAARQWVERNEASPNALLGAIQPDSSVTFDDPEKPILYFNAKTRYLQLENTSEGLVFSSDELVGPGGWQENGGSSPAARAPFDAIGTDREARSPHCFYVYAALNSKPSKLHCFIAKAKLDAYMAAFEALQA